MDRSEVIDLTGPLTSAASPSSPPTPLPAGRIFPVGHVLRRRIQKLAGELGQEEIAPHHDGPTSGRYSTGCQARSEAKPDDQLLIHIRSGDIFSTWVAPHYPQPPLAFYKLVIQRLLAEKRIASIKMVFENRLNPVIPALEAYIAEPRCPADDAERNARRRRRGARQRPLPRLRARHLRAGRLPPLRSCRAGLLLRLRLAAAFQRHPDHREDRRGSRYGRRVHEGRRMGQLARAARLMLDYPIENLAFDDALDRGRPMPCRTAENR